MIVELLKSRFSVRKYQNRPVPDPVLHDILEAGRLSPSGGNQQPWAFGVITDPGLISQIAHIAYQQDWIALAPLLILLCTIPVSDEQGGRDIQLQRFPALADAIAEMDQALYWSLNQEEHQTKIAGTHMVLAAHEHGVGACWVSRFDVKRISELLHLPENYIPTEILVFGYPAQPQKHTQKKSLKALVFYNDFEA